MADIAIQSPPSAVFLSRTHVRSQIAGPTAPTQGQSVYLDPTTGKVLATDGTSTSKVAFRGIVVGLGGAGAGIDVVEDGYVAGFDLSSLAYDAPVYVSDTPGRLSDAAGTHGGVAGRVVATTDKDPVTGKPSKLLYVRPSVI